MSKAPFRPLDFIRTVMSDGELGGTEKLALVAMAMGTDNDSFKVRRSLTDIARAMGGDRKNLGRIIARGHVALYFQRVERPNRRRVDVWLRQEPRQTLAVSGPMPDSHEVSGPMQEPRPHGARDPKAWGERPQGMGPETPPSAPICPPSATTPARKPGSAWANAERMQREQEEGEVNKGIEVAPLPANFHRPSDFDSSGEQAS